jgi:hypothetical protein
MVLYEPTIEQYIHYDNTPLLYRGTCRPPIFREQLLRSGKRVCYGK